MSSFFAVVMERKFGFSFQQDFLASVEEKLRITS